MVSVFLAAKSVIALLIAEMAVMKETAVSNEHDLKQSCLLFCWCSEDHVYFVICLFTT